MRRSLVLLLAFAAILPASSSRSQAPPRGGTLRIALLRSHGDEAVAPQALPEGIAPLLARLNPGMMVVQKGITSGDPDLVHYPLVYLHGRAASAFGERDRAELRRHLAEGGGTLFVDAAGGSHESDASCRRLLAELFPRQTLFPIPPDDPFHSVPAGFDLAGLKRTDAAGGKSAPPELEGIEVDGRWAVIYSKLDIGDADQVPDDPGRKGYLRDDAAKIAANVLIYATQP